MKKGCKKSPERKKEIKHRQQKPLVIIYVI